MSKAEIPNPSVPPKTPTPPGPVKEPNSVPDPNRTPQVPVNEPEPLPPKPML